MENTNEPVKPLYSYSSSFTASPYSFLSFPPPLTLLPRNSPFSLPPTSYSYSMISLQIHRGPVHLIKGASHTGFPPIHEPSFDRGLGPMPHPTLIEELREAQFGRGPGSLLPHPAIIEERLSVLTSGNPKASGRQSEVGDDPGRAEAVMHDC